MYKLLVYPHDGSRFLSRVRLISPGGLTEREFMPVTVGAALPFARHLSTIYKVSGIFIVKRKDAQWTDIARVSERAIATGQHRALSRSAEFFRRCATL